MHKSVCLVAEHLLVDKKQQPVAHSALWLQDVLMSSVPSEVRHLKGKNEQVEDLISQQEPNVQSALETQVDIGIFSGE